MGRRSRRALFRIVSRLLRGAVVEASSSLLAGYDPDPPVSPCGDGGHAQRWLPRQVPTPHGGGVTVTRTIAARGSGDEALRSRAG